MKIQLKLLRTNSVIRRLDDDLLVVICN